MEHERRWGLCKSWRGPFGIIEDAFGERWLALPAQIHWSQAGNKKLEPGEAVSFLPCESKGKLCAGAITLETPRPLQPAKDMRGDVVEWANRGFGFLRAQDTQYFFHHSEITTGETSLPVGQTVDFDVIVQEDGSARAVNVRPLET
jgi:cold shock CspA family protein